MSLTPLPPRAAPSTVTNVLPPWPTLLNQLVRGPAAAHLVGMPTSHTRAFTQVAKSEQCVISSRELGRVCTRLVEEGYDSKGFRIKSKSCNFGPMAGFVCRDPLYSKKGAAYAATQEKDTVKALKDKDGVGWRAGVQQICLSDARVHELQQASDDGPAIINAAPLGTGGDLMFGTFTPPGGVETKYVLRRELRNGDRVWALYTTTERLDRNKVLLGRSDVMLGFAPIEALVNPYPAYPTGHYKNSVTGDYDLFGVWPRRSNYQPLGEDRRIAGMSAAPTNDQQILTWEDQKLGNLSNRVHLVGQLVNSLLPPAAAAVGASREMVHHSDEAGRPFVKEIELPVIAFVPTPNGVVETVGIDSLQRMRTFVQLCAAVGFQPILNPGWRVQLGVDTAALGDVGDARGWQTPLDSKSRGA